MGDKGNRTRHRVVEKSLQLFSVRGYYNTSISDILEATSLTKGGLYGHFRSKEEIWFAVYEEAVSIWRKVVFKNVRQVSDPLERILKTIENDMRDYLGGEVFAGGCFFFNMLVELSGQSDRMCRHILRGFVQFSRRIEKWLQEAEAQGMLRPGQNLKEVADFIVISLNGAAPLYAASRDPRIWKQTIAQMKNYLHYLRKASQ